MWLPCSPRLKCKTRIRTSLTQGISLIRRAASMATTVVACTLRYDRAAIAHVGDSRCYLIRGVARRYGSYSRSHRSQ